MKFIKKNHVIKYCLYKLNPIVLHTVEHFNVQNKKIEQINQAVSELINNEYNEIFLALKPLIIIMRLLGLFPSQSKTIQDSNDHIKATNWPTFLWQSKLLFPFLISQIGIVGSLYFIITQYTLFIPDIMERIILTSMVTIASKTAFLQLHIMVANSGPKWASYFHKGQIIDQLLNVTI